MSVLPHPMLDEYKTQASILLKQLRSDNTQIALNSALRFQQLQQWHNLSAMEIILSDNVKLKHALAVIAQENNYDSWADFKQYLERKQKLTSRRSSYYTLHYPRQCSGFMLEWHSDYELASSELGRTGGYLFPYNNQYFICEDGYITALGLDPDDPDWARIGYNWVQPSDKEAWQRLDSKLRAVSVERR